MGALRRLAAISAALSLLAGCKEQAKAAPRAAAPPGGGPAIVEVSVTGKGFEPARVEVAPNQPVVLRITRKVAETCADAVDVQGDPVRHMLPQGRTVDIPVKAPQSGELAFACPMKMYRAALVVAQP